MAGSLLVLVNLLGTPGRLGGLIAIIAGVVLAAPHGERDSGLLPRWWPAMALGAALLAAGLAIGLAADGPGGLLSVVGAATVAVAAFLAYPAPAGRH